MPELVFPTVRVRRSFLEAAEEARAQGRWLDLDPVDLRRAEAFDAFVRGLRRRATAPAAGLVPETVLWFVDDATWLGRVSIRHHLTDSLRDVGGHIGYEVRPSARRRGHATAMLRAALPVAADLGIDPALITCDRTNEPSRRIIEAAGGVAWRHGPDVLRYWVPTADPRPAAGGSPA